MHRRQSLVSVTFFPCSTLLLCCALACPVGATVYGVDPLGTGDFPTIQAALDACADGDVIELTPGVFQGDGNRDLDFLGKAVLLCAQGGRTRDCVIDCQGSEGEPHRGIHFHSGESLGSVVRGIAISGGWAMHGGGVWCERTASPAFIECVFFANSADTGGGAFVEESASFTACAFEDNEATWSGGGLNAYGQVELQNCIFQGNTATHGGGLYLYWSSASVAACAFLDNEATGGGGGVHCEMPSTPEFTNCTFAGNTAGNIGGGFNVEVDCTPVLSGCTFVHNGAPNGGGLWAGPLCSVTLENTLIAFGVAGEAALCVENETQFACCDLHGNAGGDWVGSIAEQYGLNGNISADPLFCDPAQGDYRIEAGSPCAPFSPPNPDCALIGAWPVGCGSTPVEIVTWGRLKALILKGPSRLR
jgi:hypothetical protein